MRLLRERSHFGQFDARDVDDQNVAILDGARPGPKRFFISTLFLDEQLLAQTRDPAMLADVEGLAQVNPVELSTWFEANRYTEAASPERIAQLESVVDFTRRLVKAFVDAGIPVLAGTDTFIPGVVAGYALHEELQALSRAGLTNDQILEAATSGPARWLGVADDRGMVAVGQRANLVLLDADPRADMATRGRLPPLFTMANSSSARIWMP